MPDIFTIVNLVLTAGIVIGVYKNKIDNKEDLSVEYRKLSERLARLEEKMNLILYQIKMKGDEK
jgi:hypothetical protein